MTTERPTFDWDTKIYTKFEKQLVKDILIASFVVDMINGIQIVFSISFLFGDQR